MSRFAKLGAFIAIGFAVAASVLHETADAAGTKPSACYDRAQSQADLNRCAARDAHESEARVGAALAALKRALPSPELADALADERAWRLYVAANCRSASNSGLAAAGSIAPLNDRLCRTRRADERTAYLRWRALTPDQRERRPMP